VSDVVLGLLRTADLDLALPLTALREAVPCPERLEPAPVRAPGLLGLLPLRGHVLPVVDLAVVLGAEHAVAPGQVVVVARSGGAVLGLLVDQVRGMARVPQVQLDPVSAVDGDLLVARVWEDRQSGGVVSVLDPDGLLRLPGVPVVREAEVAAAATGTAARGRPLTLVRCPPFTLALDVALVHSTVPSPVLTPSPADGPTCLGTTPFAGSAVAVADVLALLGVGSSDGALGCGVVLDLPDGQVVLGVGEMVGLHEVPVDAVRPLPGLASPSPGLLPEVVDVPGVGAALLLDLAALRALPEVVALSRVAVPLDDAAADDESARRAALTGAPFLRYDVGTPVCTDLAQVVEVLGRPEELLPARASAGVLGLVVHRGTPVPVVDLAAVVGRAPLGADGAARLLLVEVDGEPVAYAVAGLSAILPRTWQDDAQPVHGSTPLHRSRLVQLAGSDALLPALDLHALTRELRGVPAVPAPRAAELVAT
jgi:purine-binding chemotaxis protein CheW